MRDIDILSDIKTREVEIARLQDEISALKKVAEIYGLNGHAAEPVKPITPNPSSASTTPSTTVARKGFGETKFSMPIGDAVVQVLEKEPNGLHLDVILERVAALGVTPTRNSLDSALRDDKKRGTVELLGNRIWTLRKYVN